MNRVLSAIIGLVLIGIGVGIFILSLNVDGEETSGGAFFVLVSACAIVVALLIYAVKGSSNEPPD